MHYSPHQLAYFAHKLTLKAATDSMDRMAGALLDAQVDLNPHQIDAALFATSNPLSEGATRSRSKGAVTLAEKLAAQKERCELEGSGLMSSGEFLLYQTPDGQARIQVSMQAGRRGATKNQWGDA